MQKLSRQAAAAGGQVIQLLGNHEVMNLQEIYSYVTPEDIESFGGLEARKQAWADDGWIGSYVRNLSVGAFIKDRDNLGTVFFHGGANYYWALQSLEGINNEAMLALNNHTALELRKYSIFSTNGPLWLRDYAIAPEELVCGLLTQVLYHLGASRMIIGHTPQTNGEILRRCNSKVFVIDVGISRFYGGHSGALEIIGNTITALYPGRRVQLN